MQPSPESEKSASGDSAFPAVQISTNKELGRPQRPDLGGARDSVEFRVKDPRDGGIFPGDCNCPRKSGLAQKRKRAFQQSRAETAIAVFHQDTRTGHEIVFRVGIEREYGRADDAKTVPQGKAGARLRIEQIGRASCRERG